MSLVQFQTALADMTASPALCRAVRANPALLDDLYALSGLEARRLTGLARSDGMAANCMLYRANRLAPVALNLPDTCTALGTALNALISAYWDGEPVTDVHFLVEADRFARYLGAQPGLSDAAMAALAREGGIVAARLAASRAMARPLTGTPSAAPCRPSPAPCSPPPPAADRRASPA